MHTKMKSHEQPGRFRLKTLLGSWAIVLAVLGLVVGAAPASADTPVSLYESFAGNINITGTGGTLRTNPDGVNSCSVTNSGSMTLSGIPAGATVRKAYLYWAGSGGDPQGGVGTDYNVTFNGANITADRTYTAWYNAGGTNIVYFFGGVTDVTTQVTGNGAYTFSNLTVQNANVGGGGQYCASAAVLSAFSLLVVYDDPAESLHVVNIWEGFQTYRGASITLTPTNFVVPNPAPVTPLSSRILILTWEGDFGNSAALGGFTENLTFCSQTPCTGTALTDAYNPANNQFNSTVDMPPNGPFSGIDTTWGLDLDMYDITTQVPSGATSAQSVYSSGGDLVILANQTMSIPNVPVADLSISKGHSGNFAVNSNGTYTLSVTNNGPNDIVSSNTVTVTDTLPAGLTYVSASGTGWTCGAAGQTVTCSRPGPLVSGATASFITLTVSVGSAAYPGVTNTTTVSSDAFDNVSGNNTANDVTTVVTPDLSTSTKTWTVAGGGDANPGDVVTYRITLIETGGVPATGVTVTDNIPANVKGFTVVSAPSGTDSSTGPPTGLYSNGYLNITNISVPANGSVVIVFTVTVAAVAPGTQIDNSAAITNPAGPGATPVAPTITVSESSIPASGNKSLYLYQTPIQLSRTPNTQTTAVSLAASGGTQLWPLSPNLQLASTLSPTVNSNVPVYLVLRRGNNNGNRSITVNLQCSAGGTTLTLTQTVALTNTRTRYTFNLPLGAPLTCLAGNQWNLRVTNNSTADSVRLYPYDAGPPVIRSYAYLPTTTVINVDSVTAYSVPYTAVPNDTQPASFSTGTVYLRAVVSDPFGSYDINASNNAATQPAITIKDPNGVIVPGVNGVPMPQVADSGAATKTFEYAFLLTEPLTLGYWTVSVAAPEGTEGTVSDIGTGAFNVALPNLLVLKFATVYSDPQNGTSNPKAIPGAVVTYEIRITNSGNGSADNASVTDSLATEIGAGRLAFKTQFIDATKSCAAGEGNVLSVNGGSTWTCQSGNWSGATSTLTVPGLSIGAGGDVRVKFQATIQ